jgi:hypothetical protein
LVTSAQIVLDVHLQPRLGFVFTLGRRCELNLSLWLPLVHNDVFGVLLSAHLDLKHFVLL